MRKTYEFKLYFNKKREAFLDNLFEIASEIYNHALTLCRRYYSLSGKSIDFYKLKSHITKLTKRATYSHWTKLGSQNIQDIIERIQKGYSVFFSKIKLGMAAKPPKYKGRKKYKSITFKTNKTKTGRISVGFKFLGGNKISILGKTFKFFKNREIEGEVRTLTVKKDSCGSYWIFISCEVPSHEISASKICNVEGFDFGLKNFLTLSDGKTVECPQFFKNKLDEVAALSRSLSRKRNQNKRKVSNRYRKVRAKLARLHRDLANCRKDFHFKLSLELVREYDLLVFENLNLAEMKTKYNFGRKISDYGFGEFLNLTEYRCKDYGKTFHKIDRYYPSSKKCNVCDNINKDLKLSDRTWICPNCSCNLDRDVNAAINIKNEGRRVFLPSILENVDETSTFSSSRSPAL